MSTIIRAADHGSTVRMSEFNFDDMRAQAEKYLDGVREEARKIIQRASQESAAIRAAAQRAGLQDAAEIVRRELAVQLAPALKAIEQAIHGIQAERPAWQAHWERQAVDVAVAIASRIVRQQLPAMPEVPQTLVREALELAGRGGQVRVRMNPADYALLGEQAARLESEFSRLAPTRIEPDESVERGGCIAETDYGVIDQQFSAQLARIREELT